MVPKGSDVSVRVCACVCSGLRSERETRCCHMRICWRLHRPCTHVLLYRSNQSLSPITGSSFHVCRLLAIGHFEGARPETFLSEETPKTWNPGGRNTLLQEPLFLRCWPIRGVLYARSPFAVPCVFFCLFVLETPFVLVVLCSTPYSYISTINLVTDKFISSRFLLV